MLKTIALTSSFIVASFVLPLCAQAKDGSGGFTSFKNYKVSGKATVKDDRLTLSGFKTTAGPDLYVYLGNGAPTKQVAKLKANSGTQTYTLPAGDYSSVFIHCKRFNSTFGRAHIN